jgi:hypothetical protein
MIINWTWIVICRKSGWYRGSEVVKTVCLGTIEPRRNMKPSHQVTDWPSLAAQLSPYLGIQAESYHWAVKLPIWLFLQCKFSTSTETRVACRSNYAHEPIHSGGKYNSTVVIPNTSPNWRNLERSSPEAFAGQRCKSTMPFTSPWLHYLQGSSDLEDGSWLKILLIRRYS